MSYPVESSTGVGALKSPVLTEQKQTPADLDPAEGARRVLDTGVRLFQDDYDARMDVLAEELSKGDPLYREQLMAEIFKQDPNALKSWLTPERANALQESGRISITEKGQIAEGVAAAYNNGNIPQAQINVGQIPGKAEEGKVQFNELDNLVGRFSLNADRDAQAANAQKVQEFLEFMNSSSGPEANEFRARYSEHLINEFVLNPAVGYHRPEQQQVAASLVGNLLGATPEQGAKNLAAEVLSKYNDDQIKTIIEAASRGGGHLNFDNVSIPSDGGPIDSVHVSDGASLLINSVARTNSPNADKVAASLARLPASSPDIFEGEAGKGRTDALGNLFANHSKPILDSFTKYDTTNIGTKDDATLRQYMKDASELGALFNQVLFNKDSPYSDAARDRILAYADDLKARINTSEGDADAMSRLAMLSGAADDAITQGFNALKADEDAQKEMVSFFVDLAMAGLPTDKLNDKAAEVIGGLFTNPNVTEALKGVSGNLIDEGTGKLTDAAKDALYKTLGQEETDLLDQQVASNALRSALINGLENQRDLAAVQNYAEDVNQGINIWRK